MDHCLICGNDYDQHKVPVPMHIPACSVRCVGAYLSNELNTLARFFENDTFTKGQAVEGMRGIARDFGSVWRQCT